MARTSRRRKPRPRGPRGPQPSPPPDRSGSRRWLGRLAVCLLTPAALLLSFPPFDLWFLAWVALAGWTVLVVRATKARWALAAAALAGAVFWAAAVYWLWWITLVGYVALVVYMSSLWVARAWLIRWTVRRGGPVWLALPVVWVALEYLQAYLLSGFPWFLLAQTQYRRIWLIQIADATGQYGVSFLVALANGVLAAGILAWIRAGRSLSALPVAARRIRIPAGLLGLALGAAIGYGVFRTGQQTTRSGPVLAVVQRAYPIWLGSGSTGDEVEFTGHVQTTTRLIALARSRQTQIDLLLWPETMLPRGLNPEFMALLGPDGAVDPAEAKLRSFARQHLGSDRPWAIEEVTDILRANREFLAGIDKMLDAIDAPLLGGTSSFHHQPELARPDAPWVTRNSVLLFEPGRGPTQLYAKMQLVPFSEYVPFARSLPGLHRWLRSFVPKVMNQLHPGLSPAPIVVDRPDRPLRIAAPVCYEGTFARVCRRLVDKSGPAPADLIANLSNDGWFVWPDSRRGTTEQAQHLSHYVFRAIENRTPVVRSVNTGISASIDANGRIVATVTRNGDRTMVAGGLLLDGKGPAGRDGLTAGPRILLDRRVSLFSLVGDLFAQLVSAGGGVWILALVFGSVRKARSAGKIQSKEGRPDGATS